MARSPVKAVTENDVTPAAKETLDFDNDTLRAIAEVYKNEGNEKYREEEFSHAIYFYTEGIKVNCKDEELKAKLYSNRATAQYYLGNYIDSLSDARVATGLQPTFVKAIVRGASACVQLNRFEEAITWCDKGLAIDKNNQKLLELRSRSIKAQNKPYEGDGEKRKDQSETQSGLHMYTLHVLPVLQQNSLLIHIVHGKEMHHT